MAFCALLLIASDPVLDEPVMGAAILVLELAPVVVHGIAVRARTGDDSSVFEVSSCDFAAPTTASPADEAAKAAVEGNAAGSTGTGGTTPDGII